MNLETSLMPVHYSRVANHRHCALHLSEGQREFVRHAGKGFGWLVVRRRRLNFNTDSDFPLAYM